VECGASLAASCPNCGAGHAPGQKFCAECGTPLRAGGAAGAIGPAGSPVPGAPQAVAGELRLVSVLFVDLVGYTALSESRDAEDMRELLSRYFDTARTIVGRYGGTVEKFIGDAVMAVWGAPHAREDDAERAVRAGLELVGAVDAFGEEVGASELRARAGVVTGQVASMSAPGEALVVGDRVNTASRVQSVAEPGSVYVDDVTRQVTSAAIAYVDAGEHTMKGKAESLRLWRAQRVVAGVAGRGVNELEAPFVGRDSELRLIKELFHAGVERGSARLVAVTGPPGVGKSRLRREFENYVDGLASLVLWHSGRCLSYGEGVAYFALAEMVRQRLGIPEEETPDEAARKLQLGLERWITDASEREFLEPRLGALIGVSQPGLDRQELFAGWRLFFERLSTSFPVVLSFEDVHWADDGLLDFIDHLLEWSAEHPIFMLGLARPELTERRAGWPAGRRGATPLYLEPLSDTAVGQLLDGLVAGLPPDARGRIASQAEGIPLYALETVRALKDRGVLATNGDGGLRPVGELGDLDVPATLSSLLAARLDGLEPNERELVKAMAVFGGGFPRRAAQALTEMSDERLDDTLGSLVRKQVLAVRADPLSPDRGQYAFAQTLLRTVAYEMLSKHERRPRHIAAAAHLRAVFPNDGEEMAEVIASHLLDAYRAAAGDPDADQLRADALAALRVAAQRTRSVGAPEAAERAYATARELASSEEERTELTEQAGEMAMLAGRYDSAIELLDAAAAAHAAAGRDAAAARLAEPIVVALQRAGRVEEGVERAKAALAILERDPLDPGVASVNAALGMCLSFSGRHEEAAESLERALITAQALELPVPLCRALNARAVSYMQQTRFDEALGLWAVLADIAERHGLTDLQSSAVSNIGNTQLARDLPEALERITEAIGLSRRIGDTYGRAVGTGNLMLSHLFAGTWDELERLGEEVMHSSPENQEDAHARFAVLKAWRGESAADHMEALQPWLESDNVETHFIAIAARGSVALSERRHGVILEGGTTTVAEAVHAVGPLHESLRLLWPDTLEAAILTGRTDIAAELVEMFESEPRGRLSPYLRAELHRGRGLVAAARDAHDEVEAELTAAVADLRSLRYPYPLARAQIDLAAWMIGQGRQAEATKVLADAVAGLTPLRAAPLLGRASELLASAPAAVA
jgi:class 3 adenylate cyclase/tetratricopeptide (TPR) repeat protein